LLQTDIKGRIELELPGLLSERYFEHPCLQRAAMRLDAGQQVELIRWEYQQRWHFGDRAQRGDYLAAFPQYAEALKDLKPSFPCPRCGRTILLEETVQTLGCPNCDSET